MRGGRVLVIQTWKRISNILYDLRDETDVCEIYVKRKIRQYFYWISTRVVQKFCKSSEV